MGDINDTGAKLGIRSPRILRKAKEYHQLVDIRSSSASLAALKLTGSCKAVACLDLAASVCSQPINKADAFRLAGTTKKLYTMSLKTIESVLDLQSSSTVRDMAVQFGCTGAVTLAQRILQSYERAHQSEGSEMDFNTSLFQGAALCVACKKQKVKIDRSKVKEMSGVKKSCFDNLIVEMEKLADSLQEVTNTPTRKKGLSIVDEIERKAQQDVPPKRTRCADEEEDQKQDYEEWKRKILENAARAQANSTS